MLKRAAQVSVVALSVAVIAPTALARPRHHHHKSPAGCIPSAPRDYRHSCTFSGATNQAQGMTFSTANNARGGSPAVISFFGVRYVTSCPDGTQSFNVQVSFPIQIPLAQSGSFSFSGTYLSFSGHIHGTHASGKFTARGASDPAGSCSDVSGTFTATGKH